MSQILSTVAWARKLGFKPVPLRPRSKASIDEKYVDLNYQPPDDELWRKGEYGVGVVTGPKHSGPVDVDLDCEEAIFFASKFLPITSAVFGRKTKRSSHYLYRVEVDSLPKKAFMDPIAKATIVEIRGDGGHQTVFPGSTHETTGEIISWELQEEPDVSRVDALELEFAVKKIAIGTLVVRHLWSEGQRNEIVKHLSGILFYMEWKVDQVRSLVEAIMEYVGDDDKTRLKTVMSTFKKGERGGKVTGSNTLRAFLGNDVLVDRILEWAGDGQNAFLQDYNERFAVVAVKGKFRIAETIGIERGSVPILFAKNDFIDFMSTDTLAITDEKGKTVKVPKAKLWLGHPRRRSYRKLDFVPGEEDTPNVLNLWTGWAVDPRTAGSCKAWLDLLYYVICNQDELTYNWMLNWFANILKEPRRKTLTAPVIVGCEGAGKSLMTGYFGKIIGPSYVVVTKEDHIHGRFNRHLATCLLLHSEEALFGGDRKHASIIRSMITDPHQMFEQKGVDAEQINSYVRLLITSNSLQPAGPAHDDRRFTVIDMEGRKVSDDMAANVEIEMEGGGPAGLFKYLTEEFKYDSRVPRVNIKNEAMANLKIINFDLVASWWYECLKQGTMLPDFLAWAAKPPSQEWSNVVSSPALHLAMVLFNRNKGKMYAPDLTTFALSLNRMVGIKLERKQKYYDNPLSDDAPREVKQLPAKQYSVVNMPDLKECREAFCKYIGQTVPWPEEALEEERPAFLKF